MNPSAAAKNLTQKATKETKIVIGFVSPSLSSFSSVRLDPAFVLFCSIRSRQNHSKNGEKLLQKATKETKAVIDLKNLRYLRFLLLIFLPRDRLAVGGPAAKNLTQKATKKTKIVRW